jgi:hypothetical protein
VLGDDAVIEHPYKPSYHEPDKVPWYSRPRPGKRRSREEIEDLLRDRFFDLVCLGSFRSEGLEELRSLHERVQFPPLVFIDGADDVRIRHELVRRYPIRVYFKRDYVWKLGRPLRDLRDFWTRFRGDRALFDRTFPMPLSLVLETLPEHAGLPRDIDVSYRGLASHPRRARAIEMLRQMRDVRFSGALYAGPRDRVYKLQAGVWRRLRTRLLDDRRVAQSEQSGRAEPPEYYREIAASRIALSLRGKGVTPSLRYYEIVALGTLLVSDRLESAIPEAFEHRRHAVYCRSDLRDLPAIVRYYLRNEAEREAIVQQGRAHLLKHHTCERRAEYFLEVCRRAA